MPSGTLLYAQSGGVTAVINATAAAVIETARSTQDQGPGGPQRHPRRAARGADRHLQGVGRGDPRARPHPRRRVRLVPGQAQVAGAGPGRSTSACWRCSRPTTCAGSSTTAATIRPTPRSRCRSWRPGVRLPADLHRRAQDGRQRPGGDRLLPGLRLGREVHRGLGARGRARRRGDGRHLDQGVRVRGDGPPRRLARRRGRAGRARRRRGAAPDPVPGARRSTKPTSSPRSTPPSSASATAWSSPAKASRPPTARFVADAGGGKDSFGHTQLGGVASHLAGRVKDALGYKVHWALPDYLQRSARHLASKTDLEQAQAVGKARRSSSRSRA